MSRWRPGLGWCRLDYNSFEATEVIFSAAARLGLVTPLAAAAGSKVIPLPVRHGDAVSRYLSPSLSFLRPDLPFLLLCPQQPTFGPHAAPNLTGSEVAVFWLVVRQLI